MNPLVSIIVPMYNAATTIGGTLTGAATQTYDPVEIIVVDDGSTDSGAEVVQAYGSAVTLLSQRNGGVSSARNAGAAAATGELLFFCDADDILLPSCVEAAVAAWSSGPSDGCVSVNAYFMRPDGISVMRTGMPLFRRHDEVSRREILQRNPLLSFMLIPRATYMRVGGSDESLSSLEDWDLWLRLIFGGHRVTTVDRPHALYRWSHGSLSADHAQMLADERTLFERLLSRAAEFELTADEIAYVERRLAVGSPRELRFRADDAIDDGDFTEAARLFRAAAALSPGDVKLQARRWSVGVCPPLGRLWQKRQKGSARRY